jgi:hypothetical protein
MRNGVETGSAADVVEAGTVVVVGMNWELVVIISASLLLTPLLPPLVDMGVAEIGLEIMSLALDVVEVSMGDIVKEPQAEVLGTVEELMASVPLPKMTADVK